MTQEGIQPVRVMMLSRGGEMDGAQRQLCYLATGLDRRRYVPLVVLDGAGAIQEALCRAGVETTVARMRHWRRFPEALGRYVDAFGLARQARQAGVGLVHASDLWKSGYARFVAERLGVPCVLHVRGPMTARDIAKHRMSGAAGVIAIARRYVASLEAAGVARGRIHLVDDAVDAEEFCPDSAERAKVRVEWAAGDRVVVGLVGRLEPFKRVVEFLQAIERMPEAVRKRALFLLVGQKGPPEYMRRVEESLRRAGNDQVRLLGRRDDMPRVLSGLDLLVSLSGGSVLFEAMACGTAVFSARDDIQHAVHTRHDETAWCVDSTAAEAVAAGLERMIADAALRERLSRAGRAHVREHLSVAAMAAQTQGAYDAARNLRA